MAQGTVVNAAGLAQGIVLVTIPAASTIFTSPHEYGLSSTQYGTMFVPQVVAAITASLLGAWAARRFGTKPVYLTGLCFGLASMALLLASIPVMTDRTAAYGLLLAATASLGAGFGLTVPALNSLAAALHADRVDSAVLVLNALLGLGTTLAPVFVAVFVGLGFWWGLPILSTVLLAALIVVSLPLPLRVGGRVPEPRTPGRAGLPARFWAYAAFATAYGICETVNGNWSSLDMTSNLGATTTAAALALTAFWAMVTVGRVASAIFQLPARSLYHGLPVLLALTFLAISGLPHGRSGLGIAAFALAGLGCSALLPLTISLCQGELTAIAASVAGGVIAFYQLGYGIAAFGVGPLLDTGTSMSTVYVIAAGVAVIMAVLSFAVTRRPSTA